MGLSKNYYTDKLKGLSFTESDEAYHIQVDFTGIGIKLDRAQDALDAAVLDSVTRRMPVDTGNLKNATIEASINERGVVYLYDPEIAYGHYQYEGTLYVDPITGKGAFYSPEYGFWSRPQVEKVPSSRKLTYSQPQAVAHWGAVAIEEDSNEWLEVVRRELSK